MKGLIMEDFKNIALGTIAIASIGTMIGVGIMAIKSGREKNNSVPERIDVNLNIPFDSFATADAEAKK